MLSNLLWGYWAIILCKNPDINFDYLQFSKVRYEKYQQYKQTLINQSKLK